MAWSVDSWAGDFKPGRPLRPEDVLEPLGKPFRCAAVQRVKPSIPLLLR